MSPDLKKKVLDMYMQGHSFREIRDALGVTIGQAAGASRRAALTGEINKVARVKRHQRKPPVTAALRFGPVPLLKTGPYHCRAIISAPGEKMAICCGARVEGLTSWCREHRLRFFQRPVGARHAS